MRRDSTPQEYRIALMILWTFSTLATITRVLLRRRHRNWWWDDTFAVLALIFNSIFVAFCWLFTLAFTVRFNHVTHTAIYYVYTISHNTVMWTARLSILFILMRIAPGARYQNWLCAVAVTFVLMWIAFNTQVLIFCQRHSEWQDPSVPPQCPLGLDTAFLQVVMDTVSDAVLVFVPVHIFVQAKSFSKALKTRLIIAFATSFITSLACVVHAVSLLHIGGVTDDIIAALQISTALIVCNLPVLMPAVLRKWKGVTNLDTPDDPPPTISSLRWASRSLAVDATSDTMATMPSLRATGSSNLEAGLSSLSGDSGIEAKEG